MAVTPRACSSPSGTHARGQADRRHLDVATVLPTPAQRSTAPARRRSSSGSRWCSRSLSRPSRAARTAQHRECSSGHGPRFLAKSLAIGAQSGCESCVVPGGAEGIEPPDPLHAIHGLSPRTPLLRSVGAAQSQITTARLEPPLSLAVPYFKPQACPNPSRMTPPPGTAVAHANGQNHHTSSGRKAQLDRTNSTQGP